MGQPCDQVPEMTREELTDVRTCKRQEIEMAEKRGCSVYLEKPSPRRFSFCVCLCGSYRWPFLTEPWDTC